MSYHHLSPEADVLCWLEAQQQQCRRAAVMTHVAAMTHAAVMTHAVVMTHVAVVTHVAMAVPQWQQLQGRMFG